MTEATPRHMTFRHRPALLSLPPKAVFDNCIIKLVDSV
jgi:hypothetical protein